MENAVIYARYSSHNQREESIDGQLRECSQWAKQHGYNIVDTYIDRAISGKTDNRPDFQRMIKDSITGKFKFIIVYSLDRFARNRYDSAIYKHKLKEYDIKVLSAKENITDDPSGILVESLLEGMAEYYSAELGQKIIRGMTENALAAKWASGTVPFGYKLNTETRKLIPDPVNAPIAQMIFEKYTSGTPLIHIARELNAMHIKTAMNKEWNKGSFHRMLENEVYIGVFKWQNVRIENAVPPIISQEMFALAQKIVAENRHNKNGAPQSPKNVYILTGRIYCGHCGGHLIGMSCHSKSGKLHKYYVCKNHRRQHEKCELPSLPLDWIENLLLVKTKEILSKKGAMDKIIKQIHQASVKEAEKSELKLWQTKYKQITKQLQNCSNAVAKGIPLTQDLKATMERLEKERKDVEVQISAQKALDKIFPLDPKIIRSFMEKMLTGEMGRDMILQSMINSVKIKKDSDGKYTITVKFNCTDTREGFAKLSFGGDEGG